MKAVNWIVGGATVLLIIVFTVFPTPQKTSPPSYAAASETSISGTVEEVPEFFCAISDEPETHLVMNTDQGKLLVHVGPGRFLRSQQVAFSAHDQVTIVGTRVHYQDQDAMLARQITRGNEMFILRDRQGNPIWKK